MRRMTLGCIGTAIFFRYRVLNTSLKILIELTAVLKWLLQIWLMLTSCALIVKILIKFFVCYIETCPSASIIIRLLYFKAAWCETLCLLLFLKTCYFIFWMTNRSILLLHILMDNLICLYLILVIDNVIRIVLIKFLVVTCDPWLTRVKRSLCSWSHAQ